MSEAEFQITRKGALIYNLSLEEMNAIRQHFSRNSPNLPVMQEGYRTLRIANSKHFGSYAVYVAIHVLGIGSTGAKLSYELDKAHGLL